MRKCQLLVELSATGKPITYNTLRNWLQLAGLYEQIPNLKNRRVLTLKEVALIKSCLN